VTAGTYEEFCARFTPAQQDLVNRSVTEAPEFTDDQLHTLAAPFAGAGERALSGRQQEPDTAA
jgi:hypothetical protein